MPDHTCRCCHDKRKSTDANGKPNGRAKTACQQLAGCIQPDASPGISSIVPIRGQLNLFGNLVSGAVNAQATPQPSEGIDTTAVAEGPQAGGGASRSPPELALDTQTQATTAEGSAESASAEPGEPRQSSSAAAASATPARTPSRRSGGLFGSGAIAVRAEQREDTAARSAERNASRIIDVANPSGQTSSGCRWRPTSLGQSRRPPPRQQRQSELRRRRRARSRRELMQSCIRKSRTPSLTLTYYPYYPY
jgi:hypothetical protein